MPLPWWTFAGWELIVVAAGEGLEGDEGRVVAEQDLDPLGGVDLGLAGAAHEAFPAKGR